MMSDPLPTIVEYVLAQKCRFGVWFAQDFRHADAAFAELMRDPDVAARQSYRYPIAHIVGFKNGSRIKCASPMSLSYIRGFEIHYLSIARDDDGIAWLRQDTLDTLVACCVHGSVSDIHIVSSSSITAPPLDLIPFLKNKNKNKDKNKENGLLYGEHIERTA